MLLITKLLNYFQFVTILAKFLIILLVMRRLLGGFAAVIGYWLELGALCVTLGTLGTLETLETPETPETLETPILRVYRDSRSVRRLFF